MRVSEGSGVSRRTIEKIASGEIEHPRINHIQALLDFFEADTSCMDGLDKAKNYFGSQAELARVLGLGPMAVSSWRKRGVPPRRAAQIEKLTKGEIKAAELCPEVFAA